MPTNQGIRFDPRRVMAVLQLAAEVIANRVAR